MLLFERDEILTELLDMCLDAANGRGGVALVGGDVGSGRTALLHGLVERAVEKGVLAITATGSSAERSFQLGLVGQLFQSAALPTRVAEDVADLLDSGWGVGDTPSERAMGRTEARVVRGLHAAFRELAREQPLLVAVDDLHLADAASQQVLLYLQRRLRSVPILLVVTESAASEFTRSPLRAELTSQPYARQFRLAPLSVDGVGDLLEHRLGGGVGPGLRSPVHRLGGGNPLLVHALVEDYLAARDESDPDRAEPVVGEAFRQAVISCLHRGDGRVPRVAQALAVLGGFATRSTIARLLDVNHFAVANLMALLDASGVVREGRFPHPQARAAVLGALSHEDYVRLHLKAATLLHHDGAPAAEVARRLVAAGRVQHQWAVGVLKEAAAQALADDDPQRAVECLELARRGCDDERERAGVVALLADAQGLVNPSAAAQHLDELHRAFEQGLLDERESLALARSLAWHGRAALAVDVLGRLDGATAGAGSAHAVERQLTGEWLRHWHPSAFAVPGVSSVSGVSEVPGDSGVLAGEAWDDGHEHAEYVLESCRVGDTPLEVVVCALNRLVHADRNDRATTWCDELLGDAERRGLTTWRAVLTDVRAGIALNVGNLLEAEQLSRAALSLMSPESWGVAIGSPLSRLLLSSTLMGRFDEAGEQLKRMLPRGIVHTRFWLQYLMARGHHHLATDRPHAALDDFRTAGGLAVEWGIDYPVLVPWRGDAARVHLRLDQPDRALELVREQLARPGGDSARVRGRSLRVLAMAGDPRKRQALLQEAAELLESCGDRYELAHVYADLTEVGRTLGEFTRARSTTRRALRLAKACNAEVLRRKLLPNRGADAAGSGPADPNGLAALSAAERRVVVLAALGHTNREIGRRLFITVSTVEQHLTRAYRKLNVRRREDLPLDPTAADGES